MTKIDQDRFCSQVFDLVRDIENKSDICVMIAAVLLPRAWTL